VDDRVADKKTSMVRQYQNKKCFLCKADLGGKGGENLQEPIGPDEERKRRVRQEEGKTRMRTRIREECEV